MQTIEQFINSKILELFGDGDLDNVSGDINSISEGIKIGVEFAQQWVSVEEQLPEDSDNLVQTEKYIYTENACLVMTKNRKYSVSKRSKFKGNENSKWEWMGSSSFSDSVTNWRPIELK